MIVVPSAETSALLGALEASALAQWIRTATAAYPALSALHIVAIALLFGPIAAWDWRLLRGGDMAGLAVLRRTAAAGAALAMATGALLFLAKPLDYAFNALFQWKLATISLGLLNVAVAHAAGAGRMETAAEERPQRAVRVAAAVSLACWLGAIVLGRWIAFV